MRSLRYLNGMLTVLAVLLALQLWTTWTMSPASMAHEAHAQQGGGIPNAGAQRKEMIEALDRIEKQLVQGNELLRSGQLRVIADQPRQQEDNK